MSLERAQRLEVLLAKPGTRVKIYLSYQSKQISSLLICADNTFIVALAKKYFGCNG